MNTRSLILHAGILGAVGLLAGATPSWAGVSTGPRPTDGEITTLTVSNDVTGAPLAGATVVATYRPGSQVSRTEELGTTNGAGQLVWTPTDAGIVTLAATAQDGTTLSSNLSVYFSGVPGMGLLIMIGAGALLYGGVIRGFRSMGTPPPAFPPDT